MGKSGCSNEEFIQMFKSLGPAETAKVLGISVRNIYRRRERIERAQSTLIKSPNGLNGLPVPNEMYPKRIPFEIENGTVLIGSDAHYWPDIISPAHKGFCILASLLKPSLIVMNGDVVDGVKNSRHAPIMWAKGPSVRQELEACSDRLSEIEKSATEAKRIWLLGNHDMRFENRLSERAPEYEGIAGFALADHFPAWKIGISLWINNHVVVKHRYKGGVHATHNNTVNAGMTIVTGHLHSLKVTPFSDYRGTRFGVDTGTLANPHGEQFQYAEDNPLNHRSGFIVLTFRNGQLLWPEIVAVVDEEHIQFRGELIKV